MTDRPPLNLDETDAGLRKPGGPLRRGWTTGACATAATKAALTALLTGDFPDPVTITLPKGETPSFPLAHESLAVDSAQAAIIKDAGDDPDVTHGAMITAHIAYAPPKSGVRFFAGDGVGTVTKAGLPIEPGHAAINPVPRQMMTTVVEQLCATHGRSADIDITISIPDGAALAAQTWNPRLGIVGGLSILGTTGIVHPFSCAAWIHSIHRGIDVARASGLTHVLGSTGSTSEDAVQKHYGLPETALLDMGDFAGGLLKYLRVHPVPKITIAGGFAKITKLAQGALDLHSGRSQIDLTFLEVIAAKAGLEPDDCMTIANANTAQEVLTLAQGKKIDIAMPVAQKALETVRQTLRDAPVKTEIMIIDRQGNLIAQTGFND